MSYLEFDLTRLAVGFTITLIFGIVVWLIAKFYSKYKK